MDRLVRIAASPLLLAQGRRVRRTALILPEADGPREGQTGKGPLLRLLIFGDSSAAGVGVDHQDQALSGQLVHALAPHFTIHWQVVARTGVTTSQALHLLSAADPGQIDVAVVALGVNDVTCLTSVRSWLSAQALLLDALTKDLGTRLSCVSAIPPMGHFPLLPNPLRWVLGQHAQRLQSARAKALSGRSGYVPVEFHLPLQPSSMARDGFHPNAAAYAIWANTLAQTIRAHYVPD